MKFEIRTPFLAVGDPLGPTLAEIMYEILKTT